MEARTVRDRKRSLGSRVAIFAVAVGVVQLAHVSSVDQAPLPTDASQVRSGPIAKLAAGLGARRQPGPMAHTVSDSQVRQYPLETDERARMRARQLAVRRRVLARERAWAAVHNDLYLHGVGSQLYTAWNSKVTLKAINWYGFEYAPFVPGGLDRAPLDSILATLHELGFNALRIMFANATVEWNPIVKSGVDANPEFRNMRALDVMQRILARAHHFNIRVILCNSRSEPGRGPELISGLWYTPKYPESAWRNDWLVVANRFKDESALVGADLRNEPHIIGNSFDRKAYFARGPLWGAYQGVYYHDRDWHYAAETMGNDLLRVNPHLLIVVEGVQMYLDPDRNKLFGGLWGSNLIGVQYDKIVLDRPSQLVYSAHEYGPKMYNGHWFNKLTTYDSLARRWSHHWGYLLAAPKALQAPIFIGEFGTCDDWHSCIDDPHKPWSQGFWFSAFTRYMKAHPEVGWAYWALNPEGPFYVGENNFYSLMTPSWRSYHPMLTRGLAPLLQEPGG